MMQTLLSRRLRHIKALSLRSMKRPTSGCFERSIGISCP
jgi:hypothetical protein